MKAPGKERLSAGLRGLGKGEEMAFKLRSRSFLGIKEGDILENGKRYKDMRKQEDEDKTKFKELQIVHECWSAKQEVGKSGR